MKGAFEGHMERLALFIANEPNDVGANGRYSSDAMEAIRAAISRAYENGGGFAVMPIATLDTLTAFYARRPQDDGTRKVIAAFDALREAMDGLMLGGCEFDAFKRLEAEVDAVRPVPAAVSPDPIFLCDDTPKAGEERSSSSSAA